MLRNVPIPEASLAGIAAGAALERVRPWRPHGSPGVRRLVGGAIAGTGCLLIARSMKAAAGTDLAKADRLVTSGPYAVCRNPMYVGWWLLQAGIGMVGSMWILTTLPVVAAAVHQDVVREERRLTQRFGDEYLEYCAAVGRYVPKNRYVPKK